MRNIWAFQYRKEWPARSRRIISPEFSRFRKREKPYWSSQKVCQYLGISRWTLYRLIKSSRRGGIRGFRQGRCWRFPSLVIKAYKEMLDLPKGRVFVARILDRYQGAYKRYQVIRKPRSIWWLKPRKEFLNSRPPDERTRLRFNKVKLLRVRLQVTGITVLIVTPKYFARLPREDQKEWLRFEYPK